MMNILSNTNDRIFFFNTILLKRKITKKCVFWLQNFYNSKICCIFATDSKTEKQFGTDNARTVMRRYGTIRFDS